MILPLPTDVSRHVLPNGLTVLVRTDRSAPVVAMVTYVRAGYFDETDDVSGIAHVLEHMYFKGTPTRGAGEIARQTKASGGYLNASTIYDHTRYYAVVPASGFATGLEIQADAYANSVIDAGELARELEVIIEEAKRKADSPEAVTTETLFELLHDRHRIRRWRIGREPGLRALTRDDLLGFYRNFYRPGNTILSIVGDVDVDAALREVERRYAGLSDGRIARTPGPGESGRPGRRFRELSGDVAQTHGALGWRTPGADHADTPLLDVATMVLASGRASRLYRAVREQRLVSSITAWNYTPQDLGVAVVQWSGDPRQSRAAARATWQTVVSAAEGLTSGEVERARRLFEARTLRRLESMEGQANYLVDWEALGGVECGEVYADRVMSATASDVCAAMARHLNASDAGFLVYRPAGAEAFADGAAAAFAELEAGAHPAMAALDALSTATVVPVGRRAPRRRVEQGVHVHETANSTPLLVIPRRGSPLTHLAVFVRGGAGVEPAALGGITALMSRTALKGTTTRSATEIAALSEGCGGAISPSVSSDGLAWGISVPGRAFGEALDLLADVVLRPRFDGEALETERTLALAQLQQLRDDMSRYPQRLATEEAFAGHPYARNAVGTEDSLGAVTAADLHDWHASGVLRGSMTVAVIGDVDPEAVAGQLADAFDAVQWTAPTPLSPPEWGGRSGLRQRVVERQKAQSALVMAFPGPPRGDPARHVAHLLSIVVSGLGGRFFEELRSRQSLAYTVQAGLSARVAAGLYTAYIAMSPEKEDQARDGLLREFDKLKRAPVTAEELERARTYALGTHAIAQQSAGHVLNDVVDAFACGAGLQELGAFERRVRAVTAADIQAFACDHFDEAHRVEGVVRGVAAGR